MDSILEVLREILGEADFYRQLTVTGNPTWDYGAMIEYFFGAILICICVASVFRCVYSLFGGRR